MKTVFVLLLIATIACGDDPPPKATAQQLAADLAKSGAKTVATEINHGNGPVTWSYVQDRVATGEISWLKIAGELKPYTDAGHSEGLENAIADALPKAPEQVLSMLGESFRVDHVRSGSQFIEVPKEKVIGFLTKAKSSVKKVRDPALAKNRNKCLSEIEISLKALNTAH